MATNNGLGTVKFLINISGRMVLGGRRDADQILDWAQIVLNCDFYYFLGVCRQFSGQSESRPRLCGLVCTRYWALCELSFRHLKTSGNTKQQTVTGLVQDPHSSDFTC
jgi:hypothetical protein